MRRRNPPEGIWQPRPIPGMPERMHEVLDRIGIPWAVVSEETPCVARAVAWAERLAASGRYFSAKPHIVVQEAPSWRAFAAYTRPPCLMDGACSEAMEWVCAGSPFDPDDLNNTLHSLDYVAKSGWIALSVYSNPFLSEGRKEGVWTVGVGRVPRGRPRDPSSVWPELSPWCRNLWNDAAPLCAFLAKWNGRHLQIGLGSGPAELMCRDVGHEVAHWILADPGRRKDREFLANPPRLVPIRGLRTYREEIAVCFLQHAIIEAMGCSADSRGDIEGGLSIYAMRRIDFRERDRLSADDRRWLDARLDRVIAGVRDAAARWLWQERERVPVWLRTRVAELARSQELEVGLPTLEDLERFGLSREYERIGGRVQ